MLGSRAARPKPGIVGPRRAEAASQAACQRLRRTADWWKRAGEETGGRRREALDRDAVEEHGGRCRHARRVLVQARTCLVAAVLWRFTVSARFTVMVMFW